MMAEREKDIGESNNEIIVTWEQEYLPVINNEKTRLGIKHHRNKPASKSKAKNKKKDGEIVSIGVSMSLGEIYTHKGVGGGSGNRTKKEWFNPETERRVEILADRIAENTGDTICGNITIR